MSDVSSEDRKISIYAAIGWIITSDGILGTEDALVSEQFFPPNSEYDAYVAIRDILAQASADITVVDAYLGSSLLLTLKSLPPRNLNVQFLTVQKHLKPDLPIELASLVAAMLQSSMWCFQRAPWLA